MQCNSNLMEPQLPLIRASDMAMGVSRPNSRAVISEGALVGKGAAENQ